MASTMVDKIFCVGLGMPPAIYYLVKNYEYSIKGLLGFVVCKFVFYLALLSKVPPFPGHQVLGAQCYPFACVGWMANVKDGTSVLGP